MYLLRNCFLKGAGSGTQVGRFRPEGRWFNTPFSSFSGLGGWGDVLSLPRILV